jgi:hypothetical protein
MRKFAALLAGAAFAAALAAPLAADEKTIKGEVVDSVCYLKKAENKGEAHANCAMSCAKRGQPLAIVAADGVYVITGKYAAENNKMLLDYVAKAVSATGEVMEADGKKTIDIKTISAQK